MEVGRLSAQRQDPVAVAPNVYRVLFENDRVRMLEITMPPGDASAMHYHPDAITYVVAGGRFSVTGPDGGSMEVEVRPGEAVWQPAGAHAVENTGGAELKAIAVELKR